VVFLTEDSSLLSILIEQEHILFNLNKARVTGELDRLLSPAFCEFGTSGNVWKHADIIKTANNPDNRNIVATNFNLKLLGDDVALLTYKADITYSDGTRVYSLRSSIWKRNSVSWQLEFHQGTFAPTPHT